MYFIPCLCDASPFTQCCADTEEKGRAAFIHKVTELLENTTAAWKRRCALSRTRPLPTQEWGGGVKVERYRNVCIHAPYTSA